MNQKYFDSVVLAALNERLEQKQPTSVRSLSEMIGSSFSTIIAAVRRLEAAGRLSVERTDGVDSKYTILDGPTPLERQTLVMHLAHREAA